MLNVFDEFESVIKTMEKQGIPYALCGGLAVGVHTEIRATKDIDLLLLADDVERAKEALLSCGFQFFTEPMLFANSRIELHKLTKIEPRGRDYLFLDLMVIKTSEWKTIWESRQRLQWQDQPIWVVSRDGLIWMKKLRSSPQDLVDIEKLENAK